MNIHLEDHKVHTTSLPFSNSIFVSLIDNLKPKKKEALFDENASQKKRKKAQSALLENLLILADANGINLEDLLEALRLRAHNLNKISQKENAKIFTLLADTLTEYLNGEA